MMNTRKTFKTGGSLGIRAGLSSGILIRTVRTPHHTMEPGDRKIRTLV